MGTKVEQVDADESEERLERAAAIDVAKASGMVCTRTPGPSGSGRRLTKVWEVASVLRITGACTESITEFVQA